MAIFIDGLNNFIFNKRSLLNIHNSNSNLRAGVVLTPIFSRKKEPKEAFDENMKKAKKLYESPKLWKSSEYKRLLKFIEKAQEIEETVEVEQEDILWLWTVKGSVFLMGYRKMDEALECYDKALAINPRHHVSLQNKELVLQKLEKWDEVVINCDKYLELIPELRTETPEEKVGILEPGLQFSWDKRESDVWGLKGTALVFLDKINEALNCYNKAIEIYPSNVNALMDKAFCYAILENGEDALDCCDKAIELDPKNPTVWFRKGDTLSRSRRYGEAVRCYYKTLGINPKDWRSLNGIGLAQYHLGLYDEALENINKALECGPQGPGRFGSRVPIDVETLLNKVRVLGTQAGSDLYSLSKQKPEEWAQREKKVEEMHRAIENYLAGAIHLNLKEFLIHLGSVKRDWDSRGGLIVLHEECAECEEPSLVYVVPLYFGKKRKGWGWFGGFTCPHMKSKAKAKGWGKSVGIEGIPQHLEEQISDECARRKKEKG